MKIKKACKENECVLYFSSSNARLNALSRDALSDPEYIQIEYKNGVIILCVGTREDFKVTKSKTGQRFISGSAFMGRIVNIPQNTKLYGKFDNGKLLFEIPKEFRK